MSFTENIFVYAIPLPKSFGFQTVALNMRSHWLVIKPRSDWLWIRRQFETRVICNFPQNQTISIYPNFGKEAFYTWNCTEYVWYGTVPKLNQKYLFKKYTFIE